MSEKYLELWKAVKIVEENAIPINPANWLYDACREIIRLNEVIDDLEMRLLGATETEENWPQCHWCLSAMVQVRPGKWQCPECE